VAAPTIEESSPPSTEIIVPPEVIIIKEEIIADDDLGAIEVQSNSGASKYSSLAPPSANKVFSQNIEKLPSVKGRIGKRIFRCKYVNDSRLMVWLSENDLPIQLVQKCYVEEDSKRVLKTSLLARAWALRLEVVDEPNPHVTRSKNSTVVTS